MGFEEQPTLMEKGRERELGGVLLGGTMRERLESRVEAMQSFDFDKQLPLAET